MLQKKFKEKYNDGCIKIFKLMQLFYEDRADYDEVMAIFSADDPDFEKQHVTLNKFLNTLKVFGMKIQKTNKKFKSKNLPFSTKFDLDDLKAVSLFAHVASELPTGKVKSNVENWLKTLIYRFDDRTRALYENIYNNDNTDYSFYYSNLKDQIELCETYCNSQNKVYVTYKKNNEDITAYCNAQQVIYDNKNAYLRIFKINEKTLEDILITNIVSIKYSPSQKSENEIAKTVVFKLKGRLAKAYTLREGERVDEICDDGSIVVVNSTEPTDTLLRRLMRYDYDCVIERPKELKTKMLELINATLKNYE